MNFIHFINIIPVLCSSFFLDVVSKFKVGVVLEFRRIHHSTTIGTTVIIHTLACHRMLSTCALTCTHVCVFMRAETSTKQMIIFVLANGHSNTHIWIMMNLRRNCLNTSKSIWRWHTLLDAVALCCAVTKRISEIAGKILARYSEVYSRHKYINSIPLVHVCCQAIPLMSIDWPVVIKW